MALIELRDITKVYHLGPSRIDVLRRVSLTVERGDYVALTGASGSGKSTLLNTLGCLDRPTSGSYRLAGEEVTRMSSEERAHLRNRRIGFVFQNFNLLARTSALENVELPLLYRHDLSRRARRRRAAKLMERVGLSDRVDHVPQQLSGGQQQRVSIARALTNEPDILLADEPTGNLDSHTSQDIMRLFDELNAQGLTVVLVTHDPQIARKAKRTIVLRDGRIVQQTHDEPHAPPAVPAAVTTG